MQKSLTKNQTNFDEIKKSDDILMNYDNSQQESNANKNSVNIIQNKNDNISIKKENNVFSTETKYQKFGKEKIFEVEKQMVGKEKVYGNEKQMIGKEKQIVEKQILEKQTLEKQILEKNQTSIEEKPKLVECGRYKLSRNKPPEIEGLDESLKEDYDNIILVIKNATCKICLKSVNNRDDIILTYKCSHSTHLKCIKDKSYDIYSNCIICNPHKYGIFPLNDQISDDYSKYNENYIGSSGTIKKDNIKKLNQINAIKYYSYIGTDNILNSDISLDDLIQDDIALEEIQFYFKITNLYQLKKLGMCWDTLINFKLCRSLNILLDYGINRKIINEFAEFKLNISKSQKKLNETRYLNLLIKVGFDSELFSKMGWNLENLKLDGCIDVDFENIFNNSLKNGISKEQSLLLLGKKKNVIPNNLQRQYFPSRDFTSSRGSAVQCSTLPYGVLPPHSAPSFHNISPSHNAPQFHNTPPYNTPPHNTPQKNTNFKPISQKEPTTFIVNQNYKNNIPEKKNPNQTDESSSFFNLGFLFGG